MSEPPPVAAPLSGKPSSLAIRTAVSSRRTTPGVRSIAGVPAPESARTLIWTSGTGWPAAIRVNSSISSFSSAIVQARRSKCAVA